MIDERYKWNEAIKPFGEHTAEESVEILNAFMEKLNKAFLHQYRFEIVGIEMRKIERSGSDPIYYSKTTLRQ